MFKFFFNYLRYRYSKTVSLDYNGYELNPPPGIFLGSSIHVYSVICIIMLKINLLNNKKCRQKVLFYYRSYIWSTHSLNKVKSIKALQYTAHKITDNFPTVKSTKNRRQICATNNTLRLQRFFPMETKEYRRTNSSDYLATTDL